jgi:hypothetical protein
MHLTKLKVYFVDLSLNQKFNLDERLGLILKLIWIKQRSNNKCSQPKITYSLKCFIKKLFFANKGSIFFAFLMKIILQKSLSRTSNFIFFFSRKKIVKRTRDENNLSMVSFRLTNCFLRRSSFTNRQK